MIVVERDGIVVGQFEGNKLVTKDEQLEGDWESVISDPLQAIGPPDEGESANGVLGDSLRTYEFNSENFGLYAFELEEHGYIVRPEELPPITSLKQEETEMPLPTPRAGEAEQDFISRCMETTAGEFPDNKQRAGVCYSQWRNRNKQDQATTATALKKLFPNLGRKDL